MKKQTYREVDFATALLAHKNGQTIQCRHKSVGALWGAIIQGPESWQERLDVVMRDYEFRIVTEAEPKYREYRTIDEVPVGKVATYKFSNNGGSVRANISAYLCTDGCINIGIGARCFTSQEVLAYAKFDDGSPCGVEE